MGRRTHESIGKPLPGRTNIVVTRDPEYQSEGCVIAHSLAEAIEKAHAIEQEEIFIFGGAEVYAQALPYTNRLYLTLIDAEDPEADTFFPDYSEFSQVIETEKRDQNGLAYEWITLERS